MINMHPALDDVIDLCKAQQAVITKYEQFIDKVFNINIIEEDTVDYNPRSHYADCYKRIIIPQTSIMLKLNSESAREWDILKANMKLPDLNYYISKVQKVKDIKDE